jgi:Bacterial Ig-like domain (group 3)/Bacterial Ig domain/Beta-propeller repeat
MFVAFCALVARIRRATALFRGMGLCLFSPQISARYPGLHSLGLEWFVRTLLLWLAVGLTMGNAFAAEPQAPIWFNVDGSVFRLDTLSGEIAKTIGASDVLDMAVDGEGGLWLLADRKLIHRPALRGPVSTWTLEAMRLPTARHLQVDPYDGSVWLADDMRLLHVDAQGQRMASFWALDRIVAIQSAPDQSVWVLTERQALHYAASSAPLEVLNLPPGMSGSPIGFGVDAVRGRLWVWSGSELATFSTEAGPAGSGDFVMPLRSALVALDQRTGHLWAVVDTQLVLVADGLARAALDLAAPGLSDVRRLTADAANDCLWVVHSRGISRIRFDPPQISGDVVLNPPPGRVAALPLVIRPTIALSPHNRGESFADALALSFDLGASCFGAPCGFSDQYFARYRMDFSVQERGFGDRFMIDGHARKATASRSVFPSLAGGFTARAIDPFGHASNEIRSADAGVHKASPIESPAARHRPPDIRISAPAEGEAIPAKSSVKITVVAEARDASVTKVAFYNGTALLGTSRVPPFSYVWTGAPAGRHSLMAEVTDSLGAKRTSSAVSFNVVAGASPSVALVAPKNGANFTSPAKVALQAQVTRGDAAVAKVEFRVDGRLIGTAVAPPYRVVWNGVALGPHSAVATVVDQGGGSRTSARVAFDIRQPERGSARSATEAPNQPPKIMLTYPPNGSTLSSGDITFTVDTSDPDGYVYKVAYYDDFGGTHVIRQIYDEPPFSVSVLGLLPGTHHFWAVATDDQGATTTSNVNTVSILPPTPKPPSVQFYSPRGGVRFSPGVPISFTVLAWDDGTISDVQLIASGTVIGSAAKGSDGNYHFIWTDAPSGKYSVVAKATDNSGLSTSSIPIDLEVMTSACSARNTNAAESAQGASARAGKSTAVHEPRRVPMSFEVNRGQTAESTRFQARGDGYRVRLSDQGVDILVRSPKTQASDSKTAGARAESIQMTFAGANPAPRWASEQALQRRSNYLIGNDSKRWVTDIPHFARARALGLYPGIDALYYGRDGELEYDLIVSPGADPTRVRLRFDSATAVTADAGGDLLLTKSETQIRKHKPQAYQDIDGKRRAVEAAYVVQGNEVQIRLGAYDTKIPLIIDPVIAYSTRFGSSNSIYNSSFLDAATAIAVDAQGNAYITGYAYGVDFPQVGQLAHSESLLEVAFVSKLNADGSDIVYSTYLGGTYVDGGNAIAVDKQGNAYVAGYTESNDFPVTSGAFQTVRPAQKWDNAFVAKLNPAGNALVFATFLGGDGGGDYGGDSASGIALDKNGNVFVTGKTASANFPVTAGAFQTRWKATGIGSANAFVSKLNATGSALIYSTYVGGSTDDKASAIAIDATGNAYITGVAASADFPTTAGALHTTLGGDKDAFVSKLNATGSSLVFSTLLGGSVSADTDRSYGSDMGKAIAVQSDGSVYIAGDTNATDFPVHKAYQATSPSSISIVRDISGNSYTIRTFATFLTRLNADGSQLRFSTYFGGQWDGSGLDFGDDTAVGLALDGQANAHLFGASFNAHFPTLEPLANGVNFSDHGVYFLSRFSSDGKLNFSSAIAPIVSGALRLGGVVTDAAGSAYIAGNAADAPTTGNACNVEGPGTLFVQKVGKSSAQMRLSANVNPSAAGQPVTLSADLSGTTSPTGTVTFLDGNVPLGTSPVTVSQARIELPNLSVGTHNLSATYNGDAANPILHSVVVSQVVNPPLSTSTSLSGSVCAQSNCTGPFNYGDVLTFRFTVTPSVVGPTGAPSGWVSLVDNTSGVTLSVADVRAGAATALLNAGTYPISAVYSGSAAYLGSTSSAITVAVNPLAGSPTVTMQPPTAAKYAAPAQIELFASAQAGNRGAGVSKVEFFSGSTSIGAGQPVAGSVDGSQNGMYRLLWPVSTPGSYSIKAKVTDTLGATAQSSAVSVAVVTVAAPIVSITSPLNNASAKAPASFLIKANATADTANGAKVSRVEFYRGSLLIDSQVPNTGNVASTTWSGVAEGSYVLTAKAIDTFNKTTVSAPVTVTVKPGTVADTPPTLSFALPAAGASVGVGQPVRVVLNAAAGTSAITKVDLSIGSSTTSLTAAPYASTWTPTASGSTFMRAVATDQNGRTAIATQTVLAQPFSLAISSPAAGATVKSDEVSVTGSYQSPVLNTGVTVNDVAAQTDGFNFFVNSLPLQAGSNTIVVKLIAPDSSVVAQKSVTVTSQGKSPIVIGAEPAAGIAPLSVDIQVASRTGATINNPAIWPNGGVVLGVPSADAAATLRFDKPGTYRPVVIVTDSNGKSVTQTFNIVVRDPTVADQNFKAIWSSFSAALRAGDKTTALSYLNVQSQKKFGPVFDALMASMSKIFDSFSTIQQIELSDGVAEYAIKRADGGVKKIFFLYFAQDGAGVWRIDEM